MLERDDQGRINKVTMPIPPGGGTPEETVRAIENAVRSKMATAPGKVKESVQSGLRASGIEVPGDEPKFSFDAMRQHMNRLLKPGAHSPEERVQFFVHLPEIWERYRDKMTDEQKLWFTKRLGKLTQLYGLDLPPLPEDS
jgi:hypothetical protein